MKQENKKEQTVIIGTAELVEITMPVEELIFRYSPEMRESFNQLRKVESIELDESKFFALALHEGIRSFKSDKSKLKKLCEEVTITESAN